MVRIPVFPHAPTPLAPGAQSAPRTPPVGNAVFGVPSGFSPGLAPPPPRLGLPPLPPGTFAFVPPPPPSGPLHDPRIAAAAQAAAASAAANLAAAQTAAASAAAIAAADLSDEQLRCARLAMSFAAPQGLADAVAVVGDLGLGNHRLTVTLFAAMASRPDVDTMAAFQGGFDTHFSAFTALTDLGRVLEDFASLGGTVPSTCPFMACGGQCANAECDNCRSDAKYDPRVHAQIVRETKAAASSDFASSFRWRVVG